MSRRLGPRSPRSPLATGTVAPENEAASLVFNQFCVANTFQMIMSTFQQLCDLLELRPADHTVFYRQLKPRLTSWKAKSLWVKLDKRSSHREYNKGTAAKNSRVLIIGAGPCGLRTAIEVALMGGKAVVVEKRESFSRNNVLHLWPYLIHDLKAFGAKKFFGKFCAGAIDHISIRTLQCILLKVALLVGVEVHGGVGFVSLAEPDVSGSEKLAWRAKVSPVEHPVAEYEFDVLVGGDGKRNTLKGFKRKEFRGKLAIAITANFINRNTTAEASVEEISGVAFIFNQKFFKDLNAKTGIDLENIVYYKDETHYFVMTAKKRSLLDKGVLIADYEEPVKLLSRENVNQEALMSYAREAADVSTNHMLPDLDFAHNHYGQPDVAMFDFTSMFAAEHASRVIERHGYKLLVTLVGDSLLEPFWPTGSGCARGFLGSLDTAWMIRSWSSGVMTPLEVMAERESIYQLLSQTTPMNLSKNFPQYSIDPNTRYPNINTQFFKPFQVQHQYDGTDKAYLEQIVQISHRASKRYDYIRDSHLLLKWFQKQLEHYRSLVKVTDLTSSWRSGVALCALIHKYRPELVDVFKLDANQVADNNQKAFDMADKELGIRPVMSGQEMAQCEVPDKLTMVSYLSQFYEHFRKESVRPAKMAKTPDGLMARLKQPRSRSPSSKLALLNKISQRIRQRRPSTSGSEEEGGKEKESVKRQRRPPHAVTHKKMREEPDFLLNLRKLEEPCGGLTRLESAKKLIKESQVAAAVGVRGQNKVSMLAKDLARQFSGEPTAEEKKAQKQAKPPLIGPVASADSCFFCGERVYLVERHTAEGLFFHRGCFRCHYCASSLRLGAYAFQRSDDGLPRFYCFQHAGLEQRTRRARKRSFSDKELLEKLAPILSPGKPAHVSPGKPAPAAGPKREKFLSPPDQNQVDGVLKRTPERIEYDIESEQEESELEQTTHNLNISFMSDASSESDSSDDELEWSDDEEFSDPDASWTAIARNYSAKLKQRYGTGRGEDESDTDTPTIGASDADAETDTETEEYESAKRYSREVKPDVPKLSSSAPTSSSWTHKAAMKSPTTQEINSKRLSFFDAPTEPVRIDHWSFLGLRKDPKPVIEEETPVDIQCKPSVENKVIENKDPSPCDEHMLQFPGQDTSPVEDITPSVPVHASDPSSQALDERPVSAHMASASPSSGEDMLRESVHAEYMRLLKEEGEVAAQVEEEHLQVAEEHLQVAEEVVMEDEDEDSVPTSEEEEESTLARRRQERARRMHQQDNVARVTAGARQHQVALVSISSEDVSEINPSPQQERADVELLAAYRDIVHDMHCNPDEYQHAICEDASLLTRYDRLLRRSDSAPSAQPANQMQDEEKVVELSRTVPAKVVSGRDITDASKTPSGTGHQSRLNNVYSSRDKTLSDQNSSVQRTEPILVSQSSMPSTLSSEDKSHGDQSSILSKTYPSRNKDITEQNTQLAKSELPTRTQSAEESKGSEPKNSPKSDTRPKHRYSRSVSSPVSTQSLVHPAYSSKKTSSQVQLSPSVPVSPYKSSLPERSPQPNQEVVKSKRSFLAEAAQPVRIDAKSFLGMDSNSQSNAKSRDFMGSDRTLGRSSGNSSQSDISVKRAPGNNGDSQTDILIKRPLDPGVKLTSNDEDIKEYVKSYFKDKEQFKCEPELASMETGTEDDMLTMQTEVISESDNVDTSQRSELDTTSALVQENLKVLDDDSQCDNLSDIVSDNISLSDNKPKLRSHSPTPPRPGRLELTTVHNTDKISSPSQTYSELCDNPDTRAFGVKSPTTSEESDSAKFDTIKRRKVSASSKAQSQPPEPMSTDSHAQAADLNTGTDKPKTIAPLANIEFDLLSETDNELEQDDDHQAKGATAIAIVKPLSPETAQLIEHAQALINESEENVEKIKSDVTRLGRQISEPDFSGTDKRKSDVERDAIKRIDEMLESFEQSKETKIDALPVVSNKAQGDPLTMAEWLKDGQAVVTADISVSSPILAGHTDIQTDRPQKQSVPSVKSPVLDDLTNISHSYKLRSETTKSPILAGHSDIPLDFVSKGNDSSSLPFLSFMSRDESSQYESFGTPDNAFMVSPEDRLDAVLENLESPLIRTPESVHKVSSPIHTTEKGNDSSITEFKVSDNEGERSYTVDEKYVNEGRRRRKKSGKSNTSDSSSFTISTPSGSIDSTSSVTELNSTRASSALTPSTTGDSFSNVRGNTPGTGDESYSLDRMARANNISSTSLSLEKVLEENLRENTGSSDLSSVENVNLTAKLRSNLESTITRGSQTGSSRGSSVKGSAGDLRDLRSVSAPSSVYPVKKFPLAASSLPPTSEILNGGSVPSSRDSTVVNSANTSKDENSSYYTPNVSGMESMDTSESAHTVIGPKSPGGRTTKSDSFLDDVKPNRMERLNSDNTSDTCSSSQSSLMDAKRRFFSQAAQPLRLDANRMFASDSKKVLANSDNAKVPVPTAAVPKSNQVVGSKDLFYTPVSRPPDDGFKRPVDVRRRIASEDARAAPKQSVARELTPAEKRELWEESREQARTDARERARMLSDEELGIGHTPRKESFKQKKSATLPGASDASQKQSFRPQSARAYSTQSSEEGAKSGVTPVKRSVSAATAKDRKGGGLRLLKSTQKSPKAERKDKQKKGGDEEKENKEHDTSGEKKDKRKSLLSMFRMSKSTEKKEKSAGAGAGFVSPAVNGESSGSPKPVRKETEKEKKPSGVMFRSKKAQARALERKQAEEEEKRRSLLLELEVYDQAVGGPRTSAVKEKMEKVAPAPAKAPYTALEPPKATASDFDTESEWDTQSIRSLQSSQVSGLTEEELSKMMKKQQKAAKRRQREQELRRLHMAQEIQRQLEEVEVKQRSIEERGVAIERALRGEGPDARKDEAELMQEWFNMVHEKNVLVRYEAELMVHARELELEDRHSRLEQQLRDRMSISGEDRGAEERILQELVDVVEQRDALVSLLEEDRQREREQEQSLRAIMSTKGYELSPISYANKVRLPSLGDIQSSDA